MFLGEVTSLFAISFLISYIKLLIRTKYFPPKPSQLQTRLTLTFPARLDGDDPRHQGGGGGGGSGVPRHCLETKVRVVRLQLLGV